MVSVTETLLKDIAEKIVAAVDPRMIILFGFSCTRYGSARYPCHGGLGRFFMVSKR